MVLMATSLPENSLRYQVVAALAMLVVTKDLLPAAIWLSATPCLT